MATHFSTQNVNSKDRFAYWREAVCDTFVQLNCESPRQDQFEGEIVLNRLSKISAAFVSGSAQFVERRKSDIAATCDAFFLVSLQVRQNGVIHQNGNTAHLSPGDFALYSSIDPYALTLPDDFNQLVIQLPRDVLLRRLPNADMLTGQTVAGDGELNATVGQCLLSFAQSIEQSGPLVQHCMQDSIVDLIATGLASLDDSAIELSGPEQQLMLRAKSFIQKNIGNPDLDRTMLAKAMGISVRHLSNLFQGEGPPVSAQIRQTRLQRIASDLADQRYHKQSISEIAMRWGVNNLQHFSKSFRNEFKMSPREYRQHTLIEPRR